MLVDEKCHEEAWGPHVGAGLSQFSFHNLALSQGI